MEMAIHLNTTFANHGLVAHAFIDVNNAMNRSGYEINNSLLDFYLYLVNQEKLPFLTCDGLHVYDGNFRQIDFVERKIAVDNAFAPVQEIIEEIKMLGLPKPMVICGGTPAFTSHALRESVFCSPGTCVISDWGYGESLKEQDTKRDLDRIKKAY
ncbi:MAG: hypothetical protein EAZ58_02650 [Flavobacterium sp.]|nr:MAG: hypothetical protein EAZ58_02650 [Flavobacterium sp.]